MWDDSGTILTCVEEKKVAQHKGIIIACAVAGVAVLAAALLLWRQYLRTRPRWLRERLLQVTQSARANCCIAFAFELYLVLMCPPSVAAPIHNL